MHIREMTLDDYDQLIQLFAETPGIGLRSADSRPATAAYLARNPGLSFVAEELVAKDELVDERIEGTIIGCVMCGHDGRRGYLQHLVVRPEYRGQGLGARLVTCCIDKLAELGIAKTHLYVFKDNDIANAFWPRKGWHQREDVNLYSYIASDDPNA